MSAKTLSITVFLFTALTLTHAAFIDYRSGISESQNKASQNDRLPNQISYLQTRKFGVETAIMFGRTDIWRGITKQRWIEKCLCCGVFELLVKMRGGPTRVRMLELLATPKNKLQVSNEIGIDWKAVDRHIDKMLYHGLVKQVSTAGTCTTYVVTEKGRCALSLVKPGCSYDADVLQSECL